jgi:PIN domain nuclease of toxin-antitoxin system
MKLLLDTHTFIWWDSDLPNSRGRRLYFVKIARTFVCTQKLLELFGQKRQNLQ